MSLPSPAEAEAAIRASAIRPGGRMAEMVRLAAQGLAAREIAARMDVTAWHVWKTLRRAEALGLPVRTESLRRRAGEIATGTAHIPGAVWARLEVLGRERGASAPRLVRAVMQVMAEEPSLIDAVLDGRQP
ncbi:MAG: hypothetical protein Tsb0020_54390 [Haliangiales bacterium]